MTFRLPFTLKSAAIALATIVFAPLPMTQLHAQEIAATTVQDLRSRATEALLSGDLQNAAALAHELVMIDPGDPVGRGILARVALAMNNPQQARDQAIALWRNNDAPDVRYDAARLAAFSWAEMDWPFLGQYWLRRALTVAPNAEETARTIGDIKALRAATPLSVDLNFAISPSQNVNGGTEVDIITINGLPLFINLWGEPLPLSPSPIDRAYSGVSYAPSLSLDYRLQENDKNRTNVWTSLQYRGVLLSQSAKRALDGASYNGNPITERHFSFGQVTAGISHQLRFTQSDLTFSSQIGRSWARGAADQDIASIATTYTLYSNEVSATSFSVVREWRQDTAGKYADVVRNSLRLGHIQFLQNGMRLRMNLGLTDANSLSSQSAFDRVTVDGALRPQNLIDGVSIEGRVSYSWTHYPDYSFFEPVEGGRTDETVAIGIDATLDRFSYAGFSPTISLEGRRTFSNINQFAMDEVVFNLGIESSF